MSEEFKKINLLGRCTNRTQYRPYIYTTIFAW